MNTLLQFNFETGDTSCRYYEVYVVVQSDDYINYDGIEDALTSFFENVEYEDMEYDDIVETIMNESGFAWEFVKTPLEIHAIHSFWI